MNTAIGIQNTTLPNEEQQQQQPTDNSTQTTNNNNEEDAEGGIKSSLDGSIEIISDPLTGSINVAPAESNTITTADNMNSNNMADTNENKLGNEQGNDAQGTQQANINNEDSNNQEGIDDETDNQCQLWSTTQPSSEQSNSNSTQNQTTTENNTFGDIWSTEAFSYYTSYQSPLKTLLDSNSYTLNELLAQDELLQELRGCEMKLIEYFSKEEVVAELVQVLMVDVPHELPSQLEGEGGKERWIKQEIERRANKLKQDKDKEGKRSYTQALESPENKLPTSQEGLTFDASSPDNQPTTTLDINTPNGSSPTFLPSPNDNDDEVLGNEEVEKDVELTPLEEYEMRFIRYPYMACEVICSEIGSTIDVLVDGYVNNNINMCGMDTTAEAQQQMAEGEERRRPSAINDEEDSLLGDDNENEISMKEVKSPIEESEDEDNEEDVPVLDLFVNGMSTNSTSMPTSASMGVPPVAPSTKMKPSLPESTSTLPPQQQQQIKQQPKKRILDILFSTLLNTPSNTLTNRKSGYFERIINILYIKRTSAMCDYMNNTSIIISNELCLNMMIYDILGNLSRGEQEKMILGNSVSSGGSAVGGENSGEMSSSSSDYVSFSRQTSNSGNSSDNTSSDEATPTKAPSTTISCAKFPSPHAPPMLMCALFDQLHSYSIMHIVQRLLIPSPSRVQSSKNLKGEGEVSAESKESENISNDTTMKNDNGQEDEEEDNPTNAMNDQFMNTLNQMNGLGSGMFGDDDDDDDEMDDDEDDPMNQIFQCDWSTQYTSQALELLLRRLEGDTSSFLLSYGYPVGYNVDKTIAKAEDGEDAEMKESGEQQQKQDEQDEEEEESLSCSQHASEVLITIIQNSPLDSPVMISLSSNPSIQRIIDLICSPNTDNFTAHESILTCAITVLENLVLQLGGYGAVASTQTTTSDDNNRASTGESNQEAGQNRQPNTTAAVAELSTLRQHLPALLTRLSTLLTHPITETWTIPAQYSNSQPRAILGTSRLKILRLLESLVLLGDSSIDSVLEQSDCLEKCLDLFWQFEWCSMLHQSAANLLVHVFEGGTSRCGLQKYFLIRCGLIQKLIDSFGCDDNIATSCPAVKASSSCEEGNQVTMSETAPSSDDIDIEEATDDVAPVSEDDVDSAMEKEVQEQGDAIAAATSTDELVTINSSTSPPQQERSRQTFRKGYMGHVIIICQALVHACNSSSNEEVDLDAAIGDTSHTMEEEQETSETVDTTSSSLDMNDDASSSSNSKKRKDRSPVRDGDEDIKRLASSPACSDGSGSTSPIPISSAAQSSSNGDETESKQAQSTEPLSIDNILRQHPLFEKWENFVSTQLASEMTVQSTPLGGQQTSDQGGVGVNSISVINDNSDSDFLGIDQDIPSAINGSIDGLMVGEIDMDENDLEIAVGMMEALNIPPTNGGDGNRRRRRPPSADAGCNFGAKIEQPGGFKDYVYDDPLGGIHPFDNAGSSDEEENSADGDGGSPDNDSEDDGFMVVASSDGTKSNSINTTDDKNGSTKQPESNSSSSDEESDDDKEDNGKDDDDVPVLDLFQGSGSSFDDFANFAAFPENGADPFGDQQDRSGSLDDLFGSSSSDDKKDDDPFEATPFDLVDSLSSSDADDKAEL